MKITITFFGKMLMIDGTDRDAFFTRREEITNFYCWQSVDYIPSIYCNGIIVPTLDNLYSMALLLSGHTIWSGQIHHDTKSVDWWSIALNKS